MPRLIWDAVGEKIYETGVDHGVLYLQAPGSGVYDVGVAWNGLTGVTESPSGAEPTTNYADNIPYLVILSAEEFGGTIEAYTYPDEFNVCNGNLDPTPGVILSQQARQAFGMSYRTLIGNDVLGQNFGYKIHLVYGALVSPSERAYTTINESPEAITFSWEFTTTPVPSSIPNARPTALVTIDSTLVDPALLTAFENIIYGNADTNARLPMPDEVVTLLTPTP